MRKSFAILGSMTLFVAACGQRELPTTELESTSAALTPRACVVGTNRLELRDRASTQSGAAADTLVLGVNARITGDTNVLGNVTMAPNATITGNLDIGGTLSQQPGARVTGTVSRPGNATQAVLPTRSVTPGTTPIFVNDTQTISPGSYGNVEFSNHAVVRLTAGTYNLATLVIQSGANVTFDTSGGPILVQVAGNVTISSSTRLSAADPTRVTLYSNGATVNLYANSNFPGTIIAPAATIGVGNYVPISGCLGGRNVILETDTRVTGTGSITVDTGDAGPLPDVVAPDVEVDAAPDVEPEAAPDAEIEAAVDAAPDVEPEATPDAEIEAAVDAGPDVVDAAVDAPTDVVVVPPPVSVSLVVPSNWQTGYCANLQVTNTGRTRITTWHLRLDLHESTFRETWSAIYTPLGGSLYSVTPMSWNAVLEPRQSAYFGFCANKTGSNYTPTVSVIP